jgi:hypothetical protein
MVDRREEGDGADRQAPHGGDVRERRRLCQSAQGRREYAFRKYANAAWAEWAERGASGRLGEAGRRGAGLGQMGQNPKKIPF